MSRNSTIQVRIDPETKINAKEVLEQLHMTMSDAVGLFLKQIILNQGIPFEIKIPTELTAKTLEQAEKGENIKSFDSTDDLFEDLGK